MPGQCLPHCRSSVVCLSISLYISHHTCFVVVLHWTEEVEILKQGVRIRCNISVDSVGDSSCYITELIPLLKSDANA